MIDGLIAGKLYGKPARRTGNSGKAFVVAKVRTAVRTGYEFRDQYARARARARRRAS